MAFIGSSDAHKASVLRSGLEGRRFFAISLSVLATLRRADLVRRTALTLHHVPLPWSDCWQVIEAQKKAILLLRIVSLKYISFSSNFMYFKNLPFYRGIPPLHLIFHFSELSLWKMPSRSYPIRRSVYFWDRGRGRNLFSI